jgi:hypothetical protein
MDDKYNLSGLQNIFNEAEDRNEPTIAFEIINGKGKFLFMMFFDNEDESTKDQLFIFLRNTAKMVKLKLYGNHKKGQFYIYLKDFIKDWFINELLLEKSNSYQKFNFNDFFERLNLSIPNTLCLQQKINTLRGSWTDVEDDLPKDIVDDSKKTILIGDRAVPDGKKPREKTLRKLYLYADGNSEDITILIENLKRLNRTVAWTDDLKKLKSSKSVLNILNNN